MVQIPYPSSSLVKKATAMLQSSLRDLQSHRQSAPSDRRGMVKPRAGSEYITAEVVDRTREQGLETQSFPIARIEELRGHVKELRPFAEAAQALAQISDDLLFLAESGVWSGTLLYYGMLKHNAQTDEVLREKMAIINDFFSRRSTAVREEQAVARAERKVAAATRKAVRAKQAAEAIKARRGVAEPEFVVVPAHADPNGAGKAGGESGVA